MFKTQTRNVLGVNDNMDLNDSLLKISNNCFKAISSKKVLHTLVQNFVN